MAKVYVQKTSDKGQASGYAGLNPNGKVPIAVTESAGIIVTNPGDPAPNPTAYPIGTLWIERLT